MKRILLSLGLLISASAWAQGAPDICTALPLGNNCYLSGARGDGFQEIKILKIDTTDDTVLNADSGDVIKFSVAGTAEATLNNDSLTFSGASFSFIPGATSILFRNNANNATNLSITDAGVITARAGLTSTAGDLISSTSGGTVSLQESSAGAKCMGSGTHNGTTAVTISTTCWTTGSRVFVTDTSDPTGATAAQCWVTNGVNGTSFDVDCDQANDATFSWVIFHEAP